MRILSILFFTILTACATAPSRSLAVSAETSFYFGDVNMSSADGKTSYGKTTSLVKRTIDPASNRIIEIVLQPPRDPHQKPKDINTVITRIGSSNVFSAVDDGHTFDGQLIFSGDEWKWNSWTYNIKLIDGSKLEGKGSIDSQGLKTEKTFYKPDGSPSVLLIEELKSISQQEYDSRHAQMIGP